MEINTLIINPVYNTKNYKDMKLIKHKIILIFIISLLIQVKSFSQCTSSIIKNIDSYGYDEPNVYYKDINNMLNPFEGTYIYSNNNVEFEIKLIKKIASMPPTNSYCVDMLIGGFRFQNNSSIVNCIPLINIELTDGGLNYINARSFYTGKTRGCDECGDNEKWLIGSIEDPVSGSVDELFIRKVVENGQEAIKIFIFHSLTFRKAGDPIPPPITYPVNQWFTLLKQ